MLALKRPQIGTSSPAVIFFDRAVKKNLAVNLRSQLGRSSCAVLVHHKAIEIGVRFCAPFHLGFSGRIAVFVVLCGVTGRRMCMRYLNYRGARILSQRSGL